MEVVWAREGPMFHQPEPDRLIRHFTKWVVKPSEVNGMCSKGVVPHEKFRLPLHAANIKKRGTHAKHETQ